MALTFKSVRSFLAGDVSFQESVDITSDGLKSIDVTVAGNTTDMEIELVLDITKIKAVFISSDVALSFQTNVAATPVDTISILAGKPVIWVENDPRGALFTQNLTKAFLTNATANPATFKLRILHDATPG